MSDDRKWAIGVVHGEVVRSEVWHGDEAARAEDDDTEHVAAKLEQDARAKAAAAQEAKDRAVILERDAAYMREQREALGDLYIPDATPAEQAVLDVLNAGSDAVDVVQHVAAEAAEVVDLITFDAATPLVEAASDIIDDPVRGIPAAPGIIVDTAKSVAGKVGDVIEDVGDLLGGEDDPEDRTTDSDADGLTDWVERHQTGTDPSAWDSDKDGSGDADELSAGTDPWLEDTDGDGLWDGSEAQWGTDVLGVDSDGDGLNDGFEVHIAGSNPLSGDTDGDGLGDHAEVQDHRTDPRKTDSDGDGLADGTELEEGLDPTAADSDGDGLGDLAEAQGRWVVLEPEVNVSDFEPVDVSTVVAVESVPLVASPIEPGVEETGSIIVGGAPVEPEIDVVAEPLNATWVDPLPEPLVEPDLGTVEVVTSDTSLAGSLDDDSFDEAAFADVSFHDRSFGD